MKNIYLWKGRNCAGGDLAETVKKCQELGLWRVWLKIGDSTNLLYASYPNEMKEAVSAFKNGGIHVWGWHYIYGGIRLNKSGQVVSTNGSTPEQEAQFAKWQVKELDLNGYVIDAEREFKAYDQENRAARFIRELQGIQVDHVGLSSYRFPSLHREFPWIAFLAGCDLHIPQVYWSPGRAVTDLNRSIDELRSIKDLPFLPTGRAYIGDGHPNPTPAELTAFMDAAQARECEGVSFWALDFLYLHAGGDARAKAIADFDFDYEGGVDPEAKRQVEVITSYLNLRSQPSTYGATYAGFVYGGAKFFVLETVSANGYYWARIGLNVWIAVRRLSDGYQYSIITGDEI